MASGGIEGGEFGDFGGFGNVEGLGFVGDGLGEVHHLGHLDGLLGFLVVVGFFDLEGGVAAAAASAWGHGCRLFRERLLYILC